MILFCLFILLAGLKIGGELVKHCVNTTLETQNVQLKKRGQLTWVVVLMEKDKEVLLGAGQTPTTALAAAAPYISSKNFTNKVQ